MDLLIDIGNSRVKWATLKDGQLGPQHALARDDWSKADWLQLLQSSGARVDRVFVATVAGERDAQSLQEAVEEGGAAFEFVWSQAEAAGVRNAYSEPAQLGVDRWLAVVAASRLVDGPCCIVDIGTAATIDALDPDKRHLGGYIVPGPDLMGQSLRAGTSELAERSAREVISRGSRLADNTKHAIETGCTLAVAALVDRVVSDVGQITGLTPKLLLTGGGARAIAPLLVSTAVEIPDLVLRGLAIIVEANEKRSH